MKKFIIFTAILMICITLVGCSKKEEIDVEVTAGGWENLFDKQNTSLTEEELYIFTNAKNDEVDLAVMVNNGKLGTLITIHGKEPEKKNFSLGISIALNNLSPVLLPASPKASKLLVILTTSSSDKPLRVAFTPIL